MKDLSIATRSLLLGSILMIQAHIAMSQTSMPFFLSTLTKLTENAKFSKFCSDVKIHLDDANARERISFLNQDFHTDVFSSATHIKYWFCNTGPHGDSSAYLGVVGISFSNKVQAKKSFTTIVNSQRSSFKRKVSNHFKSYISEQEIVIVFTESIHLFPRLDSFNTRYDATWPDK